MRDGRRRGEGAWRRQSPRPKNKVASAHHTPPSSARLCERLPQQTRASQREGQHRGRRHVRWACLTLTASTRRRDGGEGCGLAHTHAHGWGATSDTNRSSPAQALAQRSAAAVWCRPEAVRWSCGDRCGSASGPMRRQGWLVVVVAARDGKEKDKQGKEQSRQREDRRAGRRALCM